MVPRRTDVLTKSVTLERWGVRELFIRTESVMET